MPIAVIPDGFGHSDPTFTTRTYVHAQGDVLKGAAATFQEVVTLS